PTPPEQAPQGLRGWGAPPPAEPEPPPVPEPELASAEELQPELEAAPASAPAFVDPWAQATPTEVEPSVPGPKAYSPEVDPWALDPFAAQAHAPTEAGPVFHPASAQSGSGARPSSFGFFELLDLGQPGQRAIVDVNSRPLAVLVHRDGVPKARIMIPANCPLPVTAQNVFHTYFDNQPGVRVVVLEGDSEDPEDCSYVGECLVMDLPLRPKGQAIEIVYAYDTDGRISVQARDVESGTQARVEFQRQR
ncbi:MAG: Hsp70 family protein, partial [Planctomycetes bacterium]|nr:Hsp70 family protein [Planctomycetota bacterium]